MIEQSHDLELLKEATSDYLGNDFDAEAWLSLPWNIMLTDGENVALLDLYHDNIYTGHWFFVVHGRAALRLAKEMLDYAFNTVGLPVIRGLTPTENDKARWFSRQVGFKSGGLIETRAGDCELFIITKKDFNG